jgi:hypothetical protein
MCSGVSPESFCFDKYSFFSSSVEIDPTINLDTFSAISSLSMLYEFRNTMVE